MSDQAGQVSKLIAALDRLSLAITLRQEGVEEPHLHHQLQQTGSLSATEVRRRSILYRLRSEEVLGPRRRLRRICRASSTVSPALDQQL